MGSMFEHGTEARAPGNWINGAERRTFAGSLCQLELMEYALALLLKQRFTRSNNCIGKTWMTRGPTGTS